MKYNKEEAVRVKELAETKMQNGDFRAARHFGLMAQRLYPDLDNITQLLTVCNIHCSAYYKLYETKMDWYRILQVERFSDESVVKKQFKKLAFLLHPDDNKFPGAKAAFKLIDEANKVLTDPAKRAVYDAVYGGVCKPAKPKPDHSNQNTSFKKQHPAADKTSTTSPGFSQSVASNNAGMPSGTEVPMPKAGKTADTTGTFQSKEVKMETVNGIIKDFKPRVNIHMDMEAGKRGGSVSMPDVSETKGSGKAEGTSKPMKKSSELFDIGSGGRKQNSSNLSAQKFQLSDGHQSKRAFTKKPHITSNEKLSDDDDYVPPPKRSKRDGLPLTAVADKEIDPIVGSTPAVLNGSHNDVQQRARSRQDDQPSNKKNKSRDSKGKEDEAVMSEKACKNKDGKSEIGANKLNSNAERKSDIDIIPDPDFSNFESKREEGSFAVNQVWAIYDPLDGMPRFYAKIGEVINPGFKLEITWLEASSNNKAEQKWSDSGLPVACGRYVNGDTEITEDNLTFSHEMCSVKAGLNACYFVYPKRGETWAVYKNWDLEWSAEPDEHKPPFDFDLVEIFTDFVEEVGVVVAYLVKVKDFISIYQRDGRKEVVSFNEMYRFSHQIPSFKLTGKEGEGVPVGSYELDTAALPNQFLHVSR